MFFDILIDAISSCILQLIPTAFGEFAVPTLPLDLCRAPHQQRAPQFIIQFCNHIHCFLTQESSLKRLLARVSTRSLSSSSWGQSMTTKSNVNQRRSSRKKLDSEKL